jgi:phosphoglycolate phosphatase-like HAD superfamily hydrolase
MIDMLCKKYNINKNKSFIVGDRWVDILSGKRSGVKTVLLEKDYSNLKTSIGGPPDDLIPNFKIKHLNELKKLI